MEEFEIERKLELQNRGETVCHGVLELKGVGSKSKRSGGLCRAQTWFPIATAEDAGADISRWVGVMSW